MNLEDTVKGMTSSDYKERFKAEFYQTAIRAEKLQRFIYKCKVDTSTKHDCPIELLEKQLRFMIEYLDILNERAKIENIEL